MRFVLLVCLIFFFNNILAQPDTSCDFPPVLGSEENFKRVDLCLNIILDNLEQNPQLGHEFTVKYIKELLPTTTSSYNQQIKSYPWTADYGKVADIISLMGSQKLMQGFVDFRVASAGSADESLSFAFAKLYWLQAPIMLELIASYPNTIQIKLINSLVWGLANNFYPHINLENYQRLIVGSHWQLLEAEHVNRSLSLRIEQELALLLKQTELAK
ncbi:MAG: hypothetical protein OEY38_22610 [Gammaproteobacteria bacterium]|nr:hypothetical protein [Gammaproteobacteria bacterium]